MIVLDEYKTIELLRKTKASISRYGDGEFKICVGSSAKSQKGNPEIQRRLCNILKSDLPNHVVGIPRIFENHSEYIDTKKAIFWAQFTKKQYTELLNPKKVYGSAFITRPDSATKINCKKYFDLVKSIWLDREVLLVRGYDCGFAKDRTIFETADTWTTFECPDRDAFDKYDELLADIVNSSNKDTVIVIALGPTATVLAYDLCVLGRQALDLGHMGMFYAEVHPKSKGLPVYEP